MTNTMYTVKSDFYFTFMSMTQIIIVSRFYVVRWKFSLDSQLLYRTICYNRQMIYGHEGALNDSKVTFITFLTWHNFEYCIFGFSLLFMILWHERKWTTMVIFHRRTEVDGRTKTDCPPYGRIRTTDHDYLS